MKVTPVDTSHLHFLQLLQLLLMIARSIINVNSIAHREIDCIPPRISRTCIACRGKHFYEIWNSITRPDVCMTRLNVSNMHAGRYRRGYDRNGAYLWDGFSRRRVVIAYKRMNGPDANRPRRHDRIINISYPFDYDVASSGRWSGPSCCSISTCCEQSRFRTRVRARALLYFRMTTRKTNALAREAIPLFFYAPSGIC